MIFKLLKIFSVSFSILLFSNFCNYLSAQNSPIPNSNYNSYRNTVTFNAASESYKFAYTDENKTIVYEYSLRNGSSFNGIKFISDGYEFYPSNYGGVCMTSPDNVNYYLWSEGISKKLLRSQMIRDTLLTEWVVSKGNEFYFHFEYKFYISGKTLVIKVRDAGKIKNYSIKKYATLASFQLDRCEGAVNPVIVGVPYLSTINVLYSNNFFTSLFFDWTKTNSSQINTFDSPFSNTSVYFAQEALYKNKTNGKKYLLDETIYMTVSSELEDVFPNIPNPVAKYKNESVNRIIYDNWDAGFEKVFNNLSVIRNENINNLWLIVHDWQNAGYDNKLPEVLPANPLYGGNEALLRVSNLCSTSGYLFSLHENYSDIYPNSSVYNISEVALDPEGNPVNGWKSPTLQAKLLKPGKIKKYLIPISTKINKTLKTSASFIDVLTAKSPSEAMDFDSRENYAGKNNTSLKITNDIGNQLRKIHNGPVSGEGYHHFYYIGYYDDFEAQIQTGKISNQQLTGGYYKPLLVDFDLRKMHDKTMVHGVGYYERFFYKDSYWKYMGRSRDSSLIYSATELAYGHGAFFSSLSYNPSEQGKLEYNYVYPVQTMYGNANAVKILYNDNGNLLTVSQYIKKYPNTFDKFESSDFMSQVLIEYDNGVKVYVNRSPHREWQLNFDNELNGWFDYHAIKTGRAVLYKGGEQPSNLVLPKENGWFCYSPFTPSN